MDINDLVFNNEKITSQIENGDYFALNSSELDESKRLRSEGSTATYPQLIKLIEKLIALTNKSRERQITFCEYGGYDNPEDVQFPIITHRVYYRKPIEIKPRTREPVNDPENSGKVINAMGQKFSYTIEFLVMDKDSEKAEETMQELEDLLLVYSGFLKQQGVSDIRFLEQLSDEAITEKESFYKIKLRYTVALERITLVSDVKIQKIIAQIQLN